MLEIATATAASVVDEWELGVVRVALASTPVEANSFESPPKHKNEIGSEYLRWHYRAAEDSLRPTHNFGETWTRVVDATAGPTDYSTRDFHRLVTSPKASLGERANQDRLQLLVRKYVSGRLSPEESARLAMVTGIVRAVLPTVTPEDFALLDEIEERRQTRKEEAEALLRALEIE